MTVQITAAPMLTKWETLTHFFCLVSEEHAAIANRQERDVETHISVLGYRDILQDLDFNLYLKIFSEVIAHSKNSPKLCKPEATSVTHPKKRKNFSFLTEKLKSIEYVCW
jgi:hypothetical protein